MSEPNPPPRSIKQMVTGYVTGVFLVGLALLFTRQLRVIYQSTPSAFFFFAIILSGWRGGIGPAIVASLLSSLAIIFWLSPPLKDLNDLAVETWRFAMFLLVGIFTSWLMAKQKRITAELRQAKYHLEERVNFRTKELASVNEALRESEAKLKKAERIGNIGYWQRDLTADRIFWSEQTCRIFGIHQLEGCISQAQWEELIFPADRGRQREALERASHDVHFYDVEYRIKRPDGELRFVHVREEIVRDPSGQVVRLFGTVQDITERRQVESALREHQELLRVLTENANDLIRVHDVKGHSIYASPSVERFYGRPAAEIFDSAHPDDLDSCHQWWQRVLSGSTERLQWRVRDRGGKWRWLDSSASLFEFKGQPHIVTVCRDITENKRSADVVRQSEVRLRLAIDTIPVMAWTLRPDGVVDFLNRRWVDYSGISLEQYVADPAAPIHPEDRSRVLEKWRTEMEIGEGYEDEMRLRGADGEYRWFLVRTAPLRDEQGKIVKWYGVSADIEGRKRAEQALFETKSRLELILENSPLAITGLDPEGRITSWNKAAERLFGWSASEAFGQLCKTILPEGREEYRQSIAKVMQGETILGLVTYRRKKSGNLLTCSVSFAPQRNERGEPTGVTAIIEDVTARKKAEDAIRQSQQLLESVLATIPVGVVVTNKTGDIILSNAMSQSIWGRLIISGGERWEKSRAVWHETGKRVEAADWASIRTLTNGETILNELLDIETFDGQRKTIRNSTVPIRNANGKIAGAVIVNEDVTEAKKSEENLRHAQVELAHVARVTMMGELTASIAHEVNQPLAAVVTNADAASRWLDADPPNLNETREAVQRIARDGTRASEVIRRIRALMKKSEPSKTSVNINELIQETVALTQPELKYKKVSLETDLRPQLPHVPADRVQLQQVLLNLILNAVDSLSAVSGEPRILRLQTKQNEAQSVQIVVQDTGEGIKPDEIDRLFEPFHTTKPHGLGMGLSISRSIVEAHGGQLWATPNDGRGATFQLTLPAHNGGAS